MKDWMKQNWQFITTGISGILIVIGCLVGSDVGDFWTAVIFLSAFVIGGFEQAKEGIQATIKTKKLNVELLMILAATGASIIGYWFEGAILIFIFSVSGALETYTTNKSKREITKLMAFQPERAFRLLSNGDLEEVAAKELQLDDMVFVRPGESVPIDGVIVRGSTTLNEAAINGESVPATKTVGADVFGGTVNVSSAITVKVTQTFDNTIFSKIIRLVESAQSEPSKTARFIERFEDAYVKAVLLFVLVMMFLPHFALGWSWNETFYRAMVLLTVASPCALVASVMPATLAAISNGARHGILFKGGVHLENLRGVKAVAFDKTGTLTNGTPELTDRLFAENVDKQQVINVVGAMERQSLHPLAAAITQDLEAEITEKLTEIEVTDIPGWGVQAVYHEAIWQVGKAGFVGNEEARVFSNGAFERLAGEGKTIVYVAKDGVIQAMFALKDTCRPEAIRTIKALQAKGIKTIMVTGDNEQTGAAIQAELGMDYVVSGCLPEKKVDVLKELSVTYGSVAMVGDGINDAPALAHAAVGIAMGEGTDIAMETADVVLMKNDLEKIPYAYNLSERLHWITWQNICFAIAVILVLITANVFQLINLPFGVVGHEGSTILVILNGLRLLRSNRKK
ncbi:heavy metal translocating P-type ATPase [Listeria monocytogenes]|uniref:heavy metal translocating P-type ATPase n=1 Tax=Listeria monocytogenes TaxID=1639 RepID=UPI000F4D458B|nr:heavy metal translocating P-type ATPase [Listeria monocytogenes]AYY70235.1 heavy metal translocating P-type ATPase [Listeria monocytogenes]EAC8983321.1 heavy metal translocating P-type ATPase [Listeria monocytogenes]EAV9809437.1 heavy metal translocating P-type ATPase [Listeria monocytogenes]EIL9529654.1 heavy metal translocating P-type ATPase [Listeria monocytogenes]EIL9549451.1 heavy metal translocating P-type ATPase [Listeria monocytogenes]